MSVTITDLELRVNYNSKKATTGIDNLIGSLKKLKAELGETGLDTLTTNLINFSKALSKINTNKFSDTAKKIKESADEAAKGVEEATEKINEALGSIGDGDGVDPAEKLKNSLGDVGEVNKKIKKTTNLLNYLSVAHKKATKSAKHHNTMLSKLLRSFARIIFYRAIRKVISSIATSFKEGAKNVALYSKALNGLDSNNANGVLSELATTGLYLKNSFGAAVIPILKALIPLFEALSNAIVSAVNAFNMFFNALAGRTTFTKAKKYAVDYADSLDKASGSAKKLKDNLLGIDELNIISDNDSSGGGSGSDMDYSQMFEEADVDLPSWLENLKNLIEEGDYEGLGKAIADLMTNALRSIDWNYIKGKAGDFGKNFAEFFNGLIDPTMFYEVGKTIAEALNTGIEFAYNFVTTFDWTKAGLSAASLVNGFVDNFDAQKFGETVFETIKGGLDMATTFFNTVRWEEIGQKIADFISGINWGTLIIDLTELGNSILTAVKDTLKGVFEGDDGTIDVDKIMLAINSIAIVTSSIVLGNMAAAALLPALGNIAIKAAIVVTVSSVAFEGGLSLGEIMARHGLIPNSDEYWYKTFSFDTFFSTLTSDWGTTFEGLLTMLTDFVNNPLVASWGNILLGPVGIFIAGVGVLFFKFKDYVLGFKDDVASMLEKFKNAVDSFKGLFEKLSGFFGGLGESSKDMKKDVTGNVGDMWDDISEGFEDFWTDFSEGIYNFFNGIYTGVQKLINLVIEAINSFSFDIPEVEIAGQTIGGGSIGFNIPTITVSDLPAMFANGGFPTQGQLFVANEAGAEMVGGWGNQTAVANNDQIVAGIQSGVASAVSITLAPYLSQIATNTGVTANKDFSVKIGDRDIARANTRGQKSMGRQLIYSV